MNTDEFSYWLRTAWLDSLEPKNVYVFRVKDSKRTQDLIDSMPYVRRTLDSIFYGPSSTMDFKVTNCSDLSRNSERSISKGIKISFSI